MSQPDSGHWLAADTDWQAPTWALERLGRLPRSGHLPILGGTYFKISGMGREVSLPHEHVFSRRQMILGGAAAVAFAVLPHARATTTTARILTASKRNIEVNGKAASAFTIA